MPVKTLGSAVYGVESITITIEVNWFTTGEYPMIVGTELEVMRPPMEERSLTISSAKVAVDFPASFMLIASMNPCPCGFYNQPERDCTCPPGTLQKYLNKISGPFSDSIADLSNSTGIKAGHVAEAIPFGSLVSEGWAG